MPGGGKRKVDGGRTFSERLFLMGGGWMDWIGWMDGGGGVLCVSVFLMGWMGWMGWDGMGWDGWDGFTGLGNGGGRVVGLMGWGMGVRRWAMGDVCGGGKRGKWGEGRECEGSFFLSFFPSLSFLFFLCWWIEYGYSCSFYSTPVRELECSALLSLSFSTNFGLPWSPLVSLGLGVYVYMGLRNREEGSHLFWDPDFWNFFFFFFFLGKSLEGLGCFGTFEQDCWRSRRLGLG